MKKSWNIKKGKDQKKSKQCLRLLSMIRGNVSGREEASAGANLTSPPVLIRTVRHSNNVASFKFQLTWFLWGEIVKRLYQELFKKKIIRNKNKQRYSEKNNDDFDLPLQAPCLSIWYPETEKQMWSDGSRPVRWASWISPPTKRICPGRREVP